MPCKGSKGTGVPSCILAYGNDENVYGQWPRCGEIDCMEVMGQETNKAYGTLHYGNPHSQSQGTYTITDGADFSDDFHIFTCDWEPGKSYGMWMELNTTRRANGTQQQ